MKFLSLLTFSFLLIIGCHSVSEENPFEELPVFTPSIMQEFESLGDDIFFSHLAYSTFQLDDGSIFLPDRSLNEIFKFSSDGKLYSTVASQGRGPGEIQGFTFASRSFDDSIIVYDQMNKKILRFSPSGTFLEEFVLQPWEKGILSEVYDLDENHLLTVYRSIEYLGDMDLEPEAYLVIFDKESERYIQSITITDRPFARNIVNNQPQGGSIVPYSSEHLRYFNHQNSTFYSLWTEEQTIASLTTSLDTAYTITFDLSREQLSRDEINTIKDDQPNNLWRTMEPLLPAYKAIADDMITDDQNNFWLKLNHRSEFQKWLILSDSGDMLAIVQLPKDGILTHISDQHLGFRIDDHVFALLEPIKL